MLYMYRNPSFSIPSRFQKSRHLENVQIKKSIKLKHVLHLLTFKTPSNALHSQLIGLRPILPTFCVFYNLYFFDFLNLLCFFGVYLISLLYEPLNMFL